MSQQGCKLPFVYVLKKLNASPGTDIHIEEMDDKHVEVVVTHADNAAEGYTIDLAACEITMDWHEHPVPELQSDPKVKQEKSEG